MEPNLNNHSVSKIKTSTTDPIEIALNFQLEPFNCHLLIQLLSHPNLKHFQVLKLQVHEHKHKVAQTESPLQYHPSFLHHINYLPHDSQDRFDHILKLQSDYLLCYVILQVIVKGLCERLFQKHMLVLICWMLYQLQNIFCLHSVALYFLVNSQFSGEFLKTIQRHLLHCHHQICLSFLSQIKFIRILISLWKKVYFMHQRSDFLCHISMNYQRLLYLNSWWFVILNLVWYQSFFLINAVDTVKFQTLFKPQNWWFQFIGVIFNSAW